MILALIGEKLAGKDTVAEYLLAKRQGTHVRYSHVLDEILRMLDLPISRRNEIDLGMALRQTFGRGILNPALRKRALAATEPLVILNGVRFPDEWDNAKQMDAVTIYITAPENVRYQRFLQRSEKADDASQTSQQFHEQEQEATEKEIPNLGSQADHQIENDGTMEDLHKKVDELLAKLNL